MEIYTVTPQQPSKIKKKNFILADDAITYSIEQMRKHCSGHVEMTTIDKTHYIKGQSKSGSLEMLTIIPEVLE